MSHVESIRKRFAPDHALTAVAIAAGVVAFAQSYLRWLHPFIDAGRDLYIPEQLHAGARLYHDVLYFYPPLTPWLLAWLPSKSIVAYVILGVAVASLTAIAMAAIVRPLAGPLASGAALLLFFSFNVCGTGGWGSNYFFPYAHAATFGMLFFLGGAGLLYRGRRVAGTALLLASSWTKIEFALFGLAVVLLVDVVGCRRLAERKTSAGRYASAAVYIVVIIVSMTVVYASPVLRENIFPSSLLAGDSARAFYAQVSGTSNWQENLLLSLRGAVLIGATVLLLRLYEKHRLFVITLVAVLAIFLANPGFFRAWTILQLALIPFAVRRPREPLAFLLLLSIAASSRIWLNIAPSWYGFVFTVPLELLMVYVLFAWLPERGVYSRRAALLWLPSFVLAAASGLVAAHFAYREGEPVRTIRGTYYDTSPGRAAAVARLIEHLGAVGARELVVMPEGLAVNYLAGVKTPLRRHTFTPAEIADSEAEVLRELGGSRPERIAVVPRDVSEFGIGPFGVGYGVEIARWLRTNYTVEARFGEIVLLTTRRGTPLPGSPFPRTPAPTSR